MVHPGGGSSAVNGADDGGGFGGWVRSWRDALWPSRAADAVPQQIAAQEGRLVGKGKDEDHLDGNTWKDLPEELFLPIFAALPAPSIFRLRAVCKKWDAILRDEKFFKMCAVRTRAPFCILQLQKGYAAYSLESERWHTWPFKLVPKDAMKSVRQCITAGAAGGLVLLELHKTQDKEKRILYVMNPMNKSSKEVATVPEIDDVFTSVILGMKVDSQSGSYKILAVNYGVHPEDFLYNCQHGVHYEGESEAFTFYVYDSDRGSWETQGKWPTDAKQFFHSSALHNGSVYCLASDGGEHHLFDSPPLCHVFCIDREMSHQFPTPTLDPTPMTFAHLFEMRGQLMLAGGNTNETTSGLISMHIWKLDPDERNWLKVLTMPDHLLEELSPPADAKSDCHFRYKCVTSSEYLCVTAHSFDLSSSTIVMCHVATHHWWLVPQYPESKYWKKFLLEPRFDLFL